MTCVYLFFIAQLLLNIKYLAQELCMLVLKLPETYI